jgi:flagellin-like hook-associated protein FlgL
MQAVVEGARSGTTSQRASATTQFTDLANQMAQLVNDATYQGLNLLTSSNAQLITQFSDRTAATYVVVGFNLVEPTGGNSRSLFTQTNAVFTAQGTLLFSQVVGDAAGAGGSPTTGITGFSQLNLAASIGSTYPGSQVEQIFSATETRISFAISQIEAVTQSLGTNVGILQARSDFTAQYVNDLTSGGDSLTLADLNTEAANSQALDLREQLGIQSLGVTNTLNQAVLQLIR